MLRTTALAALALVLGASSALSTTTPNSAILPQTPNRGYAGLTTSTGLNNFVTLYTAGPNGSRCYSITATSIDSIGHNVTLQFQNSGNVMYQLTQVVGIAAGNPPYSGGPTVPFITPSLTAGLPVDQYGNQYIQLISGDTIKVANTYNAVSAGQYISVLAICSDY